MPNQRIEAFFCNILKGEDGPVSISKAQLLAFLGMVYRVVFTGFRRIQMHIVFEHLSSRFSEKKGKEGSLKMQNKCNKFIDIRNHLQTMFEVLKQRQPQISIN